MKSLRQYITEAKSDKIFVGKAELTETSNLLSLYKEMTKEASKYKEAIAYMDSFGKDWLKTNRVRLAALILKAQGKDKSSAKNLVAEDQARNAAKVATIIKNAGLGGYYKDIYGDRLVAVSTSGADKISKALIAAGIKDFTVDGSIILFQ